MSLNLYTGTPGSGKSLHLVKTILSYLNAGLDVVSNFALIFTEDELKRGIDKHLYYIDSKEFTVTKLLIHCIKKGYILKRKEKQCLIVYDEAGGKYNSKTSNNEDRNEWIDFFTQHRKMGFEIILSCQSDKMIDRQIRGCVETEFVHRKLNNYGFFFLLPFSLFVSIERWYSAKERVNATYFRYKKKYGEKYDTFKMFEGFKMPANLLKLMNMNLTEEEIEEELRKQNKKDSQEVTEKNLEVTEKNVLGKFFNDEEFAI